MKKQKKRKLSWNARICDDNSEWWNKWIEICSTSDLEDFLNFSYDGDEIPYHWEELEKDDYLTLKNKL